MKLVEMDVHVLTQMSALTIMGTVIISATTTMVLILAHADPATI